MAIYHDYERNDAKLNETGNEGINVNSRKFTYVLAKIFFFNNTLELLDYGYWNNNYADNDCSYNDHKYWGPNNSCHHYNSTINYWTWRQCYNFWSKSTTNSSMQLQPTTTCQNRSEYHYCEGRKNLKHIIIVHEYDATNSNKNRREKCYFVHWPNFVVFEFDAIYTMKCYYFCGARVRF